MTMTPIELPAMAQFRTPVLRLFQRIAARRAKRRQLKLERATRIELAGLSDHIRHDIGLDSGVSRDVAHGNGRSLDHNQHPDIVINEWGR